MNSDASTASFSFSRFRVLRNRFHAGSNSVIRSSPGRRSITTVGTIAAVVAFLSLHASSAAGQIDVLTYHNDVGRTGQNLNETVLTPANVNSSTFGKLFSYDVDGTVYAQPLYVSNLLIPGKGNHNVVFVATEHNSVYAFDADDSNIGLLWQTSFIDPANGVTTVPSSDASTSAIVPEIGITGTPVIDRSTGTLYLVAKTKEDSQGNIHYVLRLHALDIATGAEKLGGPAVIADMIVAGGNFLYVSGPRVPGQGAGSVNGEVPLWPLTHLNRSGLLLVNGVVYTAWGSHDDNNPAHGWILGHSATTLAPVSVFNTTPNGNLGAVWMSGAAPIADAQGNIYFSTGNGTFSPTGPSPDFGDTVLKLSGSSGLSVVQSFTPADQDALNSADLDFGAGGVVALPDQSGSRPHLLVAPVKTGRVYLLDRDDLGGYQRCGPQCDDVVQVIPDDNLGAMFGIPAYFNGQLYFQATGDALKAYQISNGSLSPVPVQSVTTVGFPGAVPSVSANGSSNGIVWIVRWSSTLPSSSPAVLHAYDAANLSNELYNTLQVPADQLNWAIKFAVPTIANGKVYVGSQSTVDVLGLRPSSGNGALNGSVTTSSTSVNLSSEGTSDWIHWGAGGVDRKADGGAQISDVTLVGGGSALTYADDPRLLSWTGGTPTANSSNDPSGFYTLGTGRGFTFTVPADTTQRRLIVHVGGWHSGGTLTAHLSDASAVDYTDTSTTLNIQYDRNYTLTYRAAGPGQTLRVTWTMVSGDSNVNISAVALSGVPTAAITPTAGTPQSTVVNTAFGTALQATVRDAGNNPMPGVTVTFTAPTSGASAGFGGSATATATTNGSGVATAPMLTANGIAGSYTVTASAPGIPTSAGFNLSNTASVATGVSATAGTPQSAVINTAFGTALQATVLDAGNNPVPGVTVTFTAPTSGATARFGGSTTATATTNGSGIATAPTLTANGTLGSYAVTASAPGVATPANFSLTNVGMVAGSLIGSVNASSATVNLAAEGATDWIDWGSGGVNRKAGGGAQLSDFTEVGTGSIFLYGDDPRLLNWTGGSPTATRINDPTGSFIFGTGNGFTFTAPADTTERRLVVHVGGWQSGGRLTAQLSDGSAGDYSDLSGTILNVQYDRNYTLIYRAGGPGQTLRVTWTMVSIGASDGNVTISAAALSVTSTGSVTATAGTPQSTVINTAFGTALQATVRDAGNNPVSGVTVTFTAPASGTSARFGGSATATATTNGSGVATAPTLTATGTAGSYTVTASAPGVATPANFSLTNTAGAAASVTATAGTPQSAARNTAFGTALQATVRDAGNNPVAGVTVTFTAPASGASASFGGSATATATTNGSGVATASTLTANGTLGSYTVTASAPGVATPANFSLTNTAGAAASVTATAGTPQSAVINTAFGTALQATVRDAGNNPVAGVTVTFTAPASGASARFGGSATATATTNGSGVATAPTLTANGRLAATR